MKENEKYTIEWLQKKEKAGELDFGNIVQRKEIWDKKRRSNLILNILLKDSPELLLLETKGNESEYLAVSGKQRALNMIRFVNDEFEISNNLDIKRIDGIEISGKRFSELPILFQKDILNYELLVLFDDQSNKEIPKDVSLDLTKFAPFVISPIIVLSWVNVRQLILTIDLPKFVAHSSGLLTIAFLFLFLIQFIKVGYTVGGDLIKVRKALNGLLLMGFPTVIFGAICIYYSFIYGVY